MTEQTCQAIIRGIPHIPSITEVNVRAAPSTTVAILFKKPVGEQATAIEDIQADTDANAHEGKIYQWFQLRFADGQLGWVRDDLIDLTGDCTSQGYGQFNEKTFAFDHTRSAVVTSETPTITDPTPTDATESPTPSVPTEALPADDLERVKRAAFAVTEAFEGHGYAAYQNFDRGIVSYGRFQFTLGAGSLGTVVLRFVERSTSNVAQELGGAYLSRIMMRDESLRNDMRLKELLIAAASEPEMKRVQNEVATEGYWDRMLTISAQPRGIGLPLSLAFLFDTAINFGVLHSLITLAEGDLGVPPRSRVGTNGITEEQLITQVAERRLRGHRAQAERDNLPGLIVRGEFWVGRVSAGDWRFVGDANGTVNANGRSIQVKNPAEF